MADADRDRVEVTDENFGELLIEGLREAREIQLGRAQPVRRVVRTLNARTATVDPPATFPARRIQKIRERMGLSQQVFARVLNASPETVKAWEQGKREPDGMARALLQVADRHPHVLLERVRDQDGDRVRRRA